MSLADNLNKIAEEKNITLYRIAKDGDLSMSYVWEIAKGKRQNPSLEVLKKLSHALKVPLEKLVE
jgi:transcriptional regulator with XRE-family HTH domain